MTLSITHATQSAVVDDGVAGEIGPSEWNAAHTLSGTLDAAQMPALTGDVTTPGASLATTLATVNGNVGSFGSATQAPQITVNAKGLVTAAANVTVTPAASSVTGAGDITKVDDTNVTLTLGGTPTGAVLKATSITVGWTGTLALSRLAQGTDGQLIVGQTSAAPLYKSIAGDWTLSAAGAATLATVNSNVGTFGSATKASVVTVNAKGLVTAASESTVTPAVGSITGLGTGVATWLATPSSANLLAAVTDETGTGALVFGTSPMFTTGITAIGSAAANVLTITSMASPQSLGAGFLAQFQAADGNACILHGDASANQGFSLISRRTNGTFASKSALVTDDAILNVTGRGWDGTQYTAGGSTVMRFRAAENWSATAIGAYITFSCAANGSTSVPERVRIQTGLDVGTGVDPGAGIISALTSVNAPLLIGGSGVGSTLSLKSTTGVGSTDAIIFQVGNNGATEAFRVVTGGQIVRGTTAAQTFNTIIPSVQILGTSGALTTIQAGIYSNDAFGSTSALAKSRSTTPGSFTIVQSGDVIGTFAWRADDGAAITTCAQIRAKIDGAPGAGDLPTRIEALTAADGSTTNSIRLVIGQDGGINVGPTTTNVGAGVLKVEGTTDSTSSTTGIHQIAGGMGVAKALWVGTYVSTTPTTVGALPAAAAGNKGARMFVTDELAAVAFNTIATGGGANNVPVFSDGTNWRIG